jgi:hypothetical protein
MRPAESWDRRAEPRRAGRPELTLFTTVVRFEHAVDITLAELTVELLFPADEATRHWLVAVQDD